jgi:ATP-dependent helicase/nuclease subunit A
LDFATYPSHEPAQLALLTETLLTTGGTPRQNFPSSKTTKKLDWAKDFISLLAARCIVHEAALSSLASANESLHSISLARALFERYRAMKEARGLLDYEDLIQATGRLLCGEDMMPWVLYKLDGGLEHLLIDEAQDTAPLQWQLVHALVEEFYSGENAQSKETHAHHLRGGG